MGLLYKNVHHDGGSHHDKAQCPPGIADPLSVNTRGGVGVARCCTAAHLDETPTCADGHEPPFH